MNTHPVQDENLSTISAEKSGTFREMVSLRDNFKSRIGVAGAAVKFQTLFKEHGTREIAVNLGIALFEDGQHAEACVVLSSLFQENDDALRHREYGAIIAIYYSWAVARLSRERAVAFLIGRLEASDPSSDRLLDVLFTDFFDENLFMSLRKLPRTALPLQLGVSAFRAVYERLSSADKIDALVEINSAYNRDGLLNTEFNRPIPNYIRDSTPYSTARIALIGNCQSSALNSILYRVKNVKVVALVDVNAQGSEAYKHAEWTVRHSQDIDICFSQPMGDSFENISSSAMKKKYGDSFFQYTNLYFTGYHPDLMYYGARGLRVQSAMGDYNSRIGLIGYLKRLSVEDCLPLFCDKSYEKLDYYRKFNLSKEELLKRDSGNDVRFASEFFEIAQKRLPLYTVNHPTSHVLGPLAEVIVQATGQARPEIDIDGIRNPLVEGSIWPVYPEVARSLNLEYRGGTTFYPGFRDAFPPMTLREFLEMSFQRYDNLGYDELMSIPGSEDLANTDL